MKQHQKRNMDVGMYCIKVNKMHPKRREYSSNNIGKQGAQNLHICDYIKGKS